MHGQFLLVQLETPDEAVLGRIASFSSGGKLSRGSGEEFNIRAVKENRPVPEDLRQEYLRYNVNIRVLGVLRNTRDKRKPLTFVASHRRLPHVGSPVAFASDNVLKEIAGHNVKGAEIGHFALGEYIYAGSSDELEVEDWMQVKGPEVKVGFPIESLVSRRSFIFARAGFGKSNLNKLLFSKLYSETPTVEKRGGRRVPVGTVLFDPDGEYFWPDDKGRPGLCDVPSLQDKLVVFTSRKGPSEFYQSFVAGGIKLDIRRLKPSDVIAITLSPERQEQQNVRKLKGLSQSRWRELVDLIDSSRNEADIKKVNEILNLEENQQYEALAARSNMTSIVSMLHDKSSQLMDVLLKALSEGKLCVIDVSQMRGSQSLMLSGLILRRIFDRNQEEFTSANPQTIPTIAVVEEAQAVLNERATAAEPYIAWVKEGRKYDLGAVLITQQPGSIPTEILSQGDNWFIFHLLSSADLTSVKRANAHFSDDLLSVLLNEPIPGQGVFWSSVGGKPYPIPIRALLFEKMYCTLDKNYERSAISTYASRLREQFQKSMEKIVQSLPTPTDKIATEQLDKNFKTVDSTTEELSSESVDFLALLEDLAVNSIKSDSKAFEQIESTGIPWGVLNGIVESQLPEGIEDRRDIAFQLVPKALNGIFGQQGWHTYKVESKKTNKSVTFVKSGPGESV